MAGINIVDEIKIKDSADDLLGIDGITGSANTIIVEHAMIHAGKGFFLSHEDIVDTGDFFDILFITPSDKDVHLMTHKIVSTVSPGEFCLYEGTTVSASGDELSFFNCNRQSSITPEVLVYENPDVTDLGTKIDCDILTGTKFEGGITTEVVFEWILKRNTKYIFRYINAAGIKTDINVSTFHMEL